MPWHGDEPALAADDRPVTRLTRVREDVLDGFVSEEAARADYGAQPAT